MASSYPAFARRAGAGRERRFAQASSSRADVAATRNKIRVRLPVAAPGKDVPPRS